MRSKERSTAEKIRDIGEKLEGVASGILLWLSLLFFCALAFYSMRYSQIEEAGIPSIFRDSVGRNLLVVAAALGAAFLLCGIFSARSTHRKSSGEDQAGRGSGTVRRKSPGEDQAGRGSGERKSRTEAQKLPLQRLILVGAGAALVYLISVIWVVRCHIIPGGDGEALCYAAHRMITGNFVDMQEMGYLYFFPHQYSLLAVIHAIFSVFGVWKYQVFQHINALCMPLLFYSGYKILQFLCDRTEAVVCYLFLFLGCFPLFFYVPLVYGEVISITFTAVLMWQTAEYCRTGRKSCFVWGTLAIVIACTVRKNSLIVLIAVGIVLFVHAVKKAKIGGLLWLLAMALLVSGSDRLIHAHYEKISGMKIAGGIPYVSWIRMGMQDSPLGPGWFDNSSVEALVEHGFDTEQTALAEKKLLRQILRDMWGDKAFGMDFMRRKILSQWISPVYYYEYETMRFDCDPGELPTLTRRIYYEDKKKVQNFMDRYQSVLYFFAAVSVIVLLADRKRKHSLEACLPYIAIFGGLLFSAMWEAGSRYVLPYTAYMIPLAAMGMCRIAQLPFQRERGF